VPSPASIYAAFAPFIHVDKADRLELKTKAMPAELVTRALSVESRCARCGSPIHPFRFRRKQPERATKATGHVYVSLVCPIPVNIGCSRSPEADAAKAGFIREVRALQAQKVVPPYRGEDDWFDTHPEGMW
jgi:hypothetical protein